MDVASLTVKVVNEGLDVTAKGLDDLGKSAKDAAKEAEQSVSKFEKMKNSVKGFNESMSGLRNMALIGGGAIVGMGASILKVSGNFEAAMNGVKAVSGATGAEFDALREKAKQLGSETAYSATEAANGMEFLAMAGMNTQQVLETIPNALSLASAGSLDLATSADILSNIMSGMGLAAEESGRAADVLAATAAGANTDISALGEAMKYVAPIANTMGYSLEEAAAAVGILGNSGIAAGQAGTSLRAIMTRIAADKGAKETLQELGVATTDASGEMRSLTDILSDLQNKTKDLSSDSQIEIFKDIAGAEAMGALAVLVDGVANDSLPDLIAKLEEADGAAKAMANTKMEGFEGAIKGLQSATEGLMIAMGDSGLLDIFTDLTNRFADWIREISKADPELFKMVGTAAAVALGFSGLILAISGVGLVISGVLSAFAGFQAIGGVLAAVFGGLSLPILGVVAAITAVIAIGVALYKNWDTVKEKAGQLGSYLSTEFAGVKESVSGVVDGIKDSFNSIVQTVSPALQAVADVFKGTFGSFVQIAQGVLQLVVNTVKTQFMTIVTTIGAVLQIAFTVFKAGFDLIKNAVMTVMKIIVAIIDGDFKRIPKIMGEGISQGVAIVGNALGKIVNVIKDYGKKMFNLGKDFMQGFINGIKSLAGGVVSAASTMASNAVAAVRRAQDSHSPSKKTLKLGKDFGKGFANGIKASKKPVKTEAQKLAESAIKSVQDTIANLKKEIALFGNDDPLAEINYDIGVGKYAGVAAKDINEMKALTVAAHAMKEAKTLADKFKESLEGIKEAIKGPVSTEFEKWTAALYGGNKELSKLKEGEKLELLNEAANLDYSNLSKEMAKSNLEIDRQLEMMGARTDLDKELLKISYDLTDTMARYSYYLETGQEARYKELEAIALANAEKQKGLAILKEEQKLREAIDNDLSSIRTELLGYGINETDHDKNDYQLADTLERLRQAQEMQLLQQDEFHKLSEIAKQRHADKMAEIDNAMYQNRAGLFASASKALLGENSRMYRMLFAIEKGYALQSAWLKSKHEVLKAYSETVGSPWRKMAAAAKAAADTGLMAAAIAAVQAPIGQAHDGIMSVPKSGTWNLEKGERVLPAHTAKAMDKKLEQGGKVIIHNYSGEKAEAKQDMDGNTIVTIGKIVDGIVDAKISNWERKAQRQGGILNRA